jgi:LacI family transcriptional regulator
MKVITTAGQEEELVQQLTGARTWGLVLDSAIPRLVKAARMSGFPVVMIEAWCPDAPFDAVVQDDFLGGRLAAEHLIGKGCKRIAWFGPINDTNHGFPRYGGAAAALAEHGMGFSRTIPLELQAPDLVAQARKLLRGRERPRAVLALWRHAATALIRAAHDLDLRVGKDLLMVGWCADEIYESSYVPMFAGAPVAPAVVWSTQDMVELALARLVDRRERPHTPHTRMTVRTRLRFAV